MRNYSQILSAAQLLKQSSLGLAVCAILLALLLSSAFAAPPESPLPVPNPIAPLASELGKGIQTLATNSTAPDEINEETHFSHTLITGLESFLILSLSGIGIFGLHRWAFSRRRPKKLLHRRLLAVLFGLALLATSVGALAMVWGWPVISFLTLRANQHGLNSFLTIFLTFAILGVVYEGIYLWTERALLADNARARTLIPMMRHIAFLMLGALGLLTGLSAVGLDIRPLLAGAGIAGVAIGLGAQTLIKDFLTGFFIAAENTIAVGDSVKIGSFSGTVEALSLRTLRLRDSDGTLHHIPFSEVSKISNMSRGYAIATLDIPVPYEADLDHVLALCREIGATMQADPAFAGLLLAPVDILGVEKLGDFSITLRVGLRTVPGSQADARRAFLLRLKHRFDAEGIKIPHAPVFPYPRKESP